MAPRCVVEHLHRLGIVTEVCRKPEWRPDWINGSPAIASRSVCGRRRWHWCASGLGFSNRRLYYWSRGQAPGG